MVHEYAVPCDDPPAPIVVSIDYSTVCTATGELRQLNTKTASVAAAGAAGSAQYQNPNVFSTAIYSGCWLTPPMSHGRVGNCVPLLQRKIKEKSCQYALSTDL